MQEFQFEEPDSETRVLYLEVPNESVVLLQGAFELSEGLGIVRTIYEVHTNRTGRSLKGQNTSESGDAPVIAIITTASQTELCTEFVTRILGDKRAITADSQPNIGGSPLLAPSKQASWRAIAPQDPRVVGSVSRGLHGDNSNEL